MKAWTCLACCLGIACAPATSPQDASVVGPEGGWGDARRGDRSSADSAPADHGALDAGLADGSPADRVSSERGHDAAQADAAVVDAQIPDRVIVDSSDAGGEDAYVFFGPYSASPMPRLIQDATNSGSTTTTVPIDVPASLNVDFVDVHFEIAHQDSRDLLIDLLPPAGSSTRLHDGLSCTRNCADNLVVDRRADVYNDTAGYWVLRVTDRAVTHTGSVLSFTVNFIP